MSVRDFKIVHALRIDGIDGLAFGRTTVANGVPTMEVSDIG